MIEAIILGLQKVILLVLKGLKIILTKLIAIVGG